MMATFCSLCLLLLADYVVDDRTAGSKDINSFVSQAILHELCDTATRDVSTLKTETLISLVRCVLKG